MIDVDYFKLYNDTYGHQAGDECLCLIAAMIRAKAGRGGDVVARVGGEEFVVLLPGTDAAGGRVVAEEILNGMRALAIPHSSSPRGWVTVSVGLAAEGRFRVAPAVLLQLADEALYASKRSGRCCVTLYESDLTLA
jgi:diguanylate cyclase (GGDEF)-like protein